MLAKPGERLRSQGLSGAGERADREARWRGVQCCPHCLLCGAQLAEHRFGVGEQDLAGGGEGDTTGVAVQQLTAEVTFEFADLLGPRAGLLRSDEGLETLAQIYSPEKRGSAERKAA